VAQIADKKRIPIKIRISGSIILSIGCLSALRLWGRFRFSLAGKSCFFALVFLAATLSALAIYELRVVYRLPQPIIEASILMIVLGCGSIYLAIGPNLPTETENHGWLEPANEPLPSDNSCVFGGDVQQLRRTECFLRWGKRGCGFRKIWR